MRNDPHRRQLAHRVSNGIEVTLYWEQATDRVTVEIFDAHLEEALAFGVAAGDALDAFHHPYAYAASREAYWVATVPATAAA
jgi:hypothetical protein